VDAEDVIDLIAALMELEGLSAATLQKLAGSRGWPTSVPFDGGLELEVGGYPLFFEVVDHTPIAYVTVLGLEDHVPGWTPEYRAELRREYEQMVLSVVDSRVGAPAVRSVWGPSELAYSTWLGQSVCVGFDESDFDTAFPTALVLACVNRIDVHERRPVSAWLLERQNVPIG